MSYLYYPGCNKYGYPQYHHSVMAILDKLGLEFEEIKDWNCCGAPALFSTQELGAFTVPARNLALGEEQLPGGEVVTICNSCYTILGKVNEEIKKDPALKKKVEKVFKQVGLKYTGSLQVRHLLDVLFNDVGLEKISAQVRRPLEGLRIAPYYGCQIVRPLSGFDDADFPQALDQVLEALGAEVVYFPMKTKCCGSSMVVGESRIAYRLVDEILKCAEDNKADLITVICPECLLNVEAFQGQINRKYKRNYKMPVLFLTQLMALAFGAEKEQVGLSKAIVSADKLLKPYFNNKD